MFAAPGSLPTLIIWRDKRLLPHASTPPALQELAALIPLPEPFEVSCYLEQILQNAFESRVGEGTTATSTDTNSTHRHGRETVGVRKGHNRPLSQLPQACEGGGENNCCGLSRPLFPIIQISFQLTCPTGPFQMMSCIKHPSGWSGRQPLQCASWGHGASEDAVSGQTPQKFHAEIRQEEKEGNSFLPFPLPSNSYKLIWSYIQ